MSTVEGWAYGHANWLWLRPPTWAPGRNVTAQSLLPLAGPCVQTLLGLLRAVSRIEALLHSIGHLVDPETPVKLQSSLMEAVPRATLVDPFAASPAPWPEDAEPLSAIANDAPRLSVCADMNASPPLTCRPRMHATVTEPLRTTASSQDLDSAPDH